MDSNMEKIINVDISKEEDLLEIYNTEKVNKKLIEYLIKEAKFINDYERINIVINNKCKTKIDITEKIIDGLKDEYENNTNEFRRNNVIQFVLLVVGVIFIFLSSLIEETSIWKEVILIIGWVPIWEMVDLELFKDYRGIRRKKIISKLLSSEFTEN